MFRVAAANKVGQSEPCEVRGVTLVRDPWGEFRDRNIDKFRQTNTEISIDRHTVR